LSFQANIEAGGVHISCNCIALCLQTNKQAVEDITAEPGDNSVKRTVSAIMKNCKKPIHSC